MKTKLQIDKREYYLKNRESILAKTRARRLAAGPKGPEYQRRRYAMDPIAAQERALNYYRNNRDAVRARRKERRETDPDVLAKQRIQRGLPPPTRPCPAQCENCDRVFEKGKIHLDHCHDTGKFRGWLCNRCNLALGHLGDNVKGLKRAIAYLERAGDVG